MYMGLDKKADMWEPSAWTSDGFLLGGGEGGAHFF